MEACSLYSTVHAVLLVFLLLHKHKSVYTVQICKVSGIIMQGDDLIYMYNMQLYVPTATISY